MNYAEAVAYLYERLPLFQQIGEKAIKKGLSNIILLCERLGNPHHQFKSVHIAGTNGKGSSSHMIASALQTAGYKTGLYTSPHLKEFTERIRINGIPISSEKVASWVTQHQSLVEEINPSFFELTVAMAFDSFAKEKIDIAVVEVGLGGRLDSTNIIHPLVSLITQISFDHQSLLGETLPEIAFEKAGIIKSSVPVIISQTQEEVKSIFIHQAKNNQSAITFADQLFKLKSPRMEDGYLTCDVWKENKCWINNLQSQLIGIYQLKNIPGVLAVIQELINQGFSISEKSIRDGIQNVITNTNLKGRWQVIQKKPMIVCDTGHNEDGIRQVVEQIKQVKYKSLFLILGFVKDKKVEKILDLFPREATYFFCQPSVLRAMEAQEVKKIADSLGISGKVILNVNEAVAEAKKTAHENDLIFVGGSTFVVAEINEL